MREGIVQTLSAHINEPVPVLRRLRPDVPEDLEIIVQRCLAKDPNQRFASSVILDQALAHCRFAGDWSQADAAKWWNALETPDSPTVTPV